MVFGWLGVTQGDEVRAGPISLASFFAAFCFGSFRHFSVTRSAKKRTPVVRADAVPADRSAKRPMRTPDDSPELSKSDENGGPPMVDPQHTSKPMNEVSPGDRSNANSPISKLVEQDRELVDRCLCGERGAWSQIYHRFHGSLLASIRGFLGETGQDTHLIDEISARVWYALVRNDFELLSKFDASRNCRFSTFLSALAKTESRLLLRSERRRKRREMLASKTEALDPIGNVLSDDEFLATLSPAEREFYCDVLISSYAPEVEAQYTQENLWQLRHRVRRKLEQFLE
jgi:hypothetical protein